MVENSDLKAKQLAFKMTGEYFLPALTIAKNHETSLDDEVWTIMKKIEF